MKKNIIVLLILSFFVIYSCELIHGSFDYRMTIINNSNNKIYFWKYFTYPDTAVGEFRPDPLMDFVNPKSSNDLPTMTRWELIFEKNLPSDTLILFIFDAEVLETTPWDTIQANYMILKRYDLSYDDLVRLDWTITYP